jgi:hypothetical protein
MLVSDDGDRHGAGCVGCCYIAGGFCVMAIELAACPDCGGCGYILLPDYSGGPFTDVMPVKETCDGCGGFGYIPVDDRHLEDPGNWCVHGTDLQAEPCELCR